MRKNDEAKQSLSLSVIKQVLKNQKWIFFLGFIGFALNSPSYFNDFFEFNKNFHIFSNQPKSIEGFFHPSGSVKVGTELTFKYSVPSNGFYSLWNQNNKGNLIRIWPINSELKAKSSEKHDSLQTYPYSLLATTPHSQENILVLWGTNSNHPPKNSYNTWEEFNEFIDTHSYEWKMKTFPIQVL